MKQKFFFAILQIVNSNPKMEELAMVFVYYNVSCCSTTQALANALNRLYYIVILKEQQILYQFIVKVEDNSKYYISFSMKIICVS